MSSDKPPSVSADTLAARETVDDTSQPPRDARVVIRAGAQHDYVELVAVDPSHYVIGDEIARGGMGRIMVARDRRLGRTVAIKQLLAACASDRARFEREARITARLQHPAIVNILEAGQWPSSEPFYAMKLVAGESLDRVIARSAQLEDRLALLPNVVSVVDALAYAHARGVIHRDLKPSNVLVGEFGETVVIDWGLAKDLEDASQRREPDVTSREVPDSGATAAGAIIGTPAYMPPEQAAGEPVDERADVYALGAILYHVISGRPPFTGRTVEEVLARVASEAPPSIGTLAPGLPLDLVAIIDKCMAFSASGRYRSAGELAKDLKRFQTGQLVGAHRYSGWQLVRRWIRRNRAPLMVALVAATVLVAFGVTSVVGIMREQKRTEQQRAVAERNRAQAEDLVGFMLGDLKEKLEPVGKLPLLEVVARKALAYYADRSQASDPDELRGRATALVNIGEVFVKQGSYEDARVQFEAALAIRYKLFADAPTSSELAHGIAVARHALGDLFRRQGKLSAALREYQEMVAVLEPLVAREPKSDSHRALLALGLERIGWIEKDTGHLDGALAQLRRSRDLRLALDPANPEARLDVSFSHDSIGVVHEIRGELATALEEFRASAAIRTALVDSEPTNMRHRFALALSHDRIGNVLLTMGDSAAALEAFRAELRIAELLTERDVTNADWQDLLGLAKARIGDVLLARGDTRGALASYEAGLALHAEIVRRDPSNVDAKHHLAIGYDKIGHLLKHTKDLPGALRSFELSRAIREERSALDPANVQWRRDISLSLDGIAEVELAMGRHDRALEIFRENLAAAKATAALDPANSDWQRDLAIAHQRVGDVLLVNHDVTAALEHLRDTGAIFEALVAKEPTSTSSRRELAVNHYKIGDALFERADHDGALQSYRSGRAVIETLSVEDPANALWTEDLAVGHENVARAARALGDRSTALEAYRAALAITEKQTAADPTNLQLRAFVKALRDDIASCCPTK